MKVIHLEKGEAGYILIPEGSQLSIEETQTRQHGKRFILVRST